MRALQYAMVVLLQGVLIVALVSGIRALGNVDTVSPAGVASVPQPTPSTGPATVRDHLDALTGQLAAVGR
jgi:hypothetical protein